MPPPVHRHSLPRTSTSTSCHIMAFNESSILRRWDGKSKTATTWTVSTQEPDLCPPAANCSIYLSDDHDHDHTQQLTPSFKVTFDQLVVKQCQPLLKNLILGSADSDSNTNACHLDRPKGNRASWNVPLSSWSCSLILPPPKLALADDALMYNVTTRNFFAWVVDAPVVGFNPTSALVALKARMDIWRAPSCDNVAALQEYAKSQSYGYLAGLHLVNTALLRSAPFIPSEYTLTSQSDNLISSTSDLTKSRQFGQLLRKRAGSILKRKSEAAKPRESSLSRPSSAPVQGSMADANLNGLTLMSGALTDNSAPKLGMVQSIVDDANWLGSAYDAISDNGKSSDTSTSTDKSSGSNTNTLSSKATTDTQSDLPDLDAKYGTVFKDFAQPSSWLPDLTPLSLNGGSLYQSPVSADPPRSYSNVPNRHSFSGDRRRPTSRSRPPSPIMEEVVVPVRKRQPSTTAGTAPNLKRFSLPPVMSHKDTESNNIAAAAGSVRTVQRFSREGDRSLSTTSHRLSTDSTSTICANCNRCKRPPCLSATNSQPQSPIAGVTRSISQSTPVATPIDTPAQRNLPAEEVDVLNQPFLSEGRWLSAKSKSKDPLKEGEITRFPSLRRRGRSSTAPSAPELPQDANARIATYTGRMRAASQTAPATRSLVSETKLPEANSRRSLDQSPLSEQRYSPPEDSTKAEQRHLPRTQTYNLTEQHQNRPLQSPVPTELGSPIRIASPTERRSSHESSRRQALQLRVSTVAPQEDRKKMSLDLPSFPEPMSSVIMKSNGRQISLALPHDDNTLLSLNHPFFTEQTVDNTPENKDDQIVFEKLLDGLQFIEKTPQATASRSYVKPAPPKKEPGVTTGFPRASSKPVQPRPQNSPKTPKSPVARLRRSTWTGTVRGWFSKDKNHNDTDFESIPRPMSKGAQCQVRVLTLDSRGNFSTSMMDSSVEDGADWR